METLENSSVQPARSRIAWRPEKTARMETSEGEMEHFGTEWNSFEGCGKCSVCDKTFNYQGLRVEQFGVRRASVPFFVILLNGSFR